MIIYIFYAEVIKKEVGKMLDYWIANSDGDTSWHRNVVGIRDLMHSNPTIDQS